MLDEGPEVRDLRRAIAQTLKSDRTREGIESRTEDRAGVSGGEAAARFAECSAGVIERLRVMARHSLIAARMLARSERNQQLSWDGAAQ